MTLFLIFVLHKSSYNEELPVGNIATALHPTTGM